MADRKAKALLIGKDAHNGKLMRVNKAGRGVHTHIIGTSGKGKSKLLEHMLQNDLRFGNGFILLDPHGDVYQHTLEYASRMGARKQVILIDPGDIEFSVGLNYLEYDPDIISSSAHAELVMRAIAKAYADEKLEEKPQLDRWLRATIQTLVAARRPIQDYYPLLSRKDDTFRNRIISELDDFYLTNEWKEFNEQDRRSQNELVRPVHNRLRMFVDDPILRRMFNQPKSTIDFRAAMDEGKAILVNLSSQRLSERQRKLIGILLIDKILAAGFSRVNISEAERRRFYVYIDEFENFLSPDIARALKELRKFGLSFVLAHQNIRQLKEQNLDVYSALGNAQLKVSFALAREDAEIIAKELFALDDDLVKDEIYQTKLFPRESIRVVEGESTGKSSTVGRGISDGVGGGTSESHMSGQAMSMGPLGMDGDVTGYYNSMNTSNSSASGYSSSITEFESETASQSRSRAIVPFYEYEEVQELTGRNFYSVDEKFERFVAWLKQQPVRRAIFKIAGTADAPIPIVIPEVNTKREVPRLLERFKQEIYTQYAILASEADRSVRASLGSLSEDPPSPIPQGDDEEGDIDIDSFYE